MYYYLSINELIIIILLIYFRHYFWARFVLFLSYKF